MELTLITHDFLQLAAYVLGLLAISVSLGAYMAKTAGGDVRFLSFIERLLYALSGVKADEGLALSETAEPETKRLSKRLMELQATK